MACANIAGLLVARGAARLQEIEIRSALGASRGRIVRQLMTESLVLAVPGAILGLILGQYAVRLFVLSIPRAQRAALPHLASFSIDPAHAWSSASDSWPRRRSAFGAIPAWQSARQGDRTTLRSRATADSRRFRLQSGFVVAQFALAVVLLAGSGLMARSVYQLLTTSPGFVTDGLLTARVNPAFFDPPAVVRVPAATARARRRNPRNLRRRDDQSVSPQWSRQQRHVHDRRSRRAAGIGDGHPHRERGLFRRDVHSSPAGARAFRGRQDRPSTSRGRQSGARQCRVRRASIGPADRLSILRRPARMGNRRRRRRRTTGRRSTRRSGRSCIFRSAR